MLEENKLLKHFKSPEYFSIIIIINYKVFRLLSNIFIIK